MDEKYEVIMCIVNAGFADTVMDVARASGARGGTIINARGTAKEETEKMLNIAMHPEKEIVLILIESTIKDDILHNLYKEVGLNSAGQGIAFTLPVDEVVGLNKSINKFE